jgi:hypothetical protein
MAFLLAAHVLARILISTCARQIVTPLMHVSADRCMFVVSVSMHCGAVMKREKEEKPVRGIFERPAGSGCW